jgi:hypothetical protein
MSSQHEYSLHQINPLRQRTSRLDYISSLFSAFHHHSCYIVFFLPKVLLTQHRNANSRKVLRNLFHSGSATVIRCPQWPVTDSKETQIWVTSKQTRGNFCGKRDRCVSLFLQTTILLKNTSLWDMTPRSLLKTGHSFAGIYCLELQDIYQRFEGTYLLRLPESGSSRDFVERLVNFNQVTWSHVP